MADDFQARSDAFMAWLGQSAEFVSPKIVLADLRARNAGRGVVAAADIAEDEVLFTIPRSSLLTVNNSTLPAKIPNEIQELDPWLSLILVMLYEYLQGENSSWKPYFDILPTEFNTLMFWSDSELAELQASAVAGKIGKESAEASFRDRLLPIVGQHADIFFHSGSQRFSNDVLVSSMHRMGSLIMAYAFDIERDSAPENIDEEGYASEEEEEALPKGMVPMADMLNADADRCNANLFYEDNALVMKALKPIAASEEIFNDYGPLPRSDLLRRYGYLTNNYAPFDVVEMSHEVILQAVSQEGRLSEADVQERIEYLDEEGIIDTGYDIAKRNVDETLDECFSTELLVLITTLALPHSEFQHLKERGKFPKIRGITTQIASLLLIVIKIRLSQYATSLEDDMQLLSAGGAQGARREMATVVRAGEKFILREAQSALTDVLASEQNAGQSKKRRIQ